MSGPDKRKRREHPDIGAPEEPGAIGPTGWTTLLVLGAIAALWSLFLWMELVLLRSGGSSFCAAGGRLDCSAIWNGAFASEIQRLTGLPVAAWGLVWSAVAFAFALAGLARAARGRPAGTVLAAVRLTALAGALTAVVMFVASLAAGGICLGCIGTYVLVAAYAAVALRRAWASGLAGWPRAAGLSAGAAASAFLLLLYPGLHTPRSTGEAGRRAVEAAAQPSEPQAPVGAAPFTSVGTGNPQRDEQLANFVRSLDPQLKQTLADSLAIYRASPAQQLPPPRAVVGAVMAPVRITDFTDILCEHCAALNETLHTLRENVPPGSYSVDARQFPLDGRCNSLLQPRKDSDDVRCVAAKLRICADPLGKEPQLAAALFEKQQGLTRKTALEIASRILPRETLDGCLDSPKVNAALAEDVTAAGRFDSDGTPIVAINGRKGTSFAPFLYAMILARGNADHPAFASLPPGDPTAHLH